MHGSAWKLQDDLRQVRTRNTATYSMTPGRDIRHHLPLSLVKIGFLLALATVVFVAILPRLGLHYAKIFHGAEDPPPTHSPREFPATAKLLQPAGVQYGRRAVPTMAWDPDALERMNQVPAFVRGMVVRSVESYCEKNDISTVTTKELDEIRSRMPTSRFFGEKTGRAAD